MGGSYILGDISNDKTPGAIIINTIEKRFMHVTPSSDKNRDTSQFE